MDPRRPPPAATRAPGVNQGASGSIGHHAAKHAAGVADRLGDAETAGGDDDGGPSALFIASVYPPHPRSKQPACKPAIH